MGGSFSKSKKKTTRKESLHSPPRSQKSSKKKKKLQSIDNKVIKKIKKIEKRWIRFLQYFEQKCSSKELRSKVEWLRVVKKARNNVDISKSFHYQHEMHHLQKVGNFPFKIYDSL